MKKISKRKITSVMEAMLNASFTFVLRFSAMLGSICGFVQQVHELHGACLHLVHHVIYLRN